MNALIGLTDAQRAMGRSAMFLAFQSLIRKGIVESDTIHVVRLKVRPSEAFSIAVSSTTEALETLVLLLILGLLLSEKGFGGEAHDLDRAIHASIYNGRLAGVPWPLTTLPQLEPEPELEKRVLQRFITLEGEGKL